MIDLAVVNHTQDSLYNVHFFWKGTCVMRNFETRQEAEHQAKLINKWIDIAHGIENKNA